MRRFNAWKTVNAGAIAKRYADAQVRHRPYRMHTEAADAWRYDDQTIYRDSPMAALFRWRDAFQNDFAERMDWSMTDDYARANHNPIAAIDGDDSDSTAYLTLKGGERISLSSEGTRDPDKDPFTYRWWCYPEPGSWDAPIEIKDADTATAVIALPKVFSDGSIHIILEVTDDGEPTLTSYKRVVINLVHQ